jgi:hypothetical protein
VIPKTIRDILVFEYNRIYVCRGNLDGEERVIYVGKAKKQAVGERMRRHITGNEKGLQKFGKMLHEYKESPSSSLDWRIEVMTKEEVEDLLGKSFPDLESAEDEMIEYLNPIANKRRKRL